MDNRTLLLALTLGCSPGGPIDGPVPARADDPSPTDPPDAVSAETGPLGQPFHDTAAAGSDAPVVGTWRDLDDWARFTALVRVGAPWHATWAQWGFWPSQRVTVAVTDGGGPVPDAQVLLTRGAERVWEARTDADGVAELYGGLFDQAGGPWGLTAIAGGYAVQQIDVRAASGARSLALSEETTARPDGAEVAFVVDTRRDHAAVTAWLAGALPDVLRRGLVELPGTPVGLVWCDDDEVGGAALSDDLTRAPVALSAADDGGGPGVALVDALEAAAGLGWSESARARLLVVLLGQAHLPAEDLPRLHAATRELARRGVRVHGLSLDASPATGFLLRALGLSTGGTWSFSLTPGRAAPTELVGPYAPRALDELLTEALADLAR